jgi:hypothetical protein
MGLVRGCHDAGCRVDCAGDHAADEHGDVERKGIGSSERHSVRNTTLKRLKDLTASGYDTVARVVNGLNGSPYDRSRTIDVTMATHCGSADMPSWMLGRKDSR